MAAQKIAECENSQQRGRDGHVSAVDLAGSTQTPPTDALRLAGCEFGPIDVSERHTRKENEAFRRIGETEIARRDAGERIAGQVVDEDEEKRETAPKDMLSIRRKSAPLMSPRIGR